MWIFLNNAFLSIVDKGGDGSTLLVRARHEGDIERVFPQVAVERTPQHDYRFRAHIDRDAVALAMAEAVKGIRYSNFKDSVQERSRHDAYMTVWGAMYRYQQHGG